jgi:hypothetical protein
VLQVLVVLIGLLEEVEVVVPMLEDPQELEVDPEDHMRVQVMVEYFRTIVQNLLFKTLVPVVEEETTAIVAMVVPVSFSSHILHKYSKNYKSSKYFHNNHYIRN